MLYFYSLKNRLYLIVKVKHISTICFLSISRANSTSKFLGFDLDLWPLRVTLGQKYFHHSKAHIWLSIQLSLTLSLYLVPFSRYSTSKFLGFDLDLWPLGVTWGQKYFHHSKAHIWLPIQLPLTLSLYLVPFSRYSTSKDFRVWPWPLTFRGHLRSKIFSPFESPYMTSYLTSIDTFSLSRTVFEIFDFKVFRVWPWPLTFRGHLRSNIFSPFESPYMTSYLTPIDTFSLSRNVFEIFDFKVFRVWPWPLTFGVTLGQKYFHHSKAHIWLSYPTSIDIFSLSRTVFEIFDFKVFRVWPWPLTFRGHLRSKIFSPFESPYMTSYLTPIDTFSLSRTVFEIFDFKVFRVWPWPLTFRGHLRSKIFHHLKAHIWLPI